MSIITSVTVQRPQGTTVSTGNLVQIDNISPAVIAASNGMIPQNSYQLISIFGVPDIETSDFLVDENNVDSKGNTVVYRVNGNPEAFDDHLECVIERKVGT